MKIATIIIRTLIGLLLLFASISYFFHLMPEPESTGNFKAFNVGLVAATYIMPMAKTVELLCGLSFVAGKYVTLANILIMPITINILFINFFLAPEGLPIAALLFLGNVFLIYRYWDNYKSVFTA
ncbi:DoxX family protein [Flavobacterium restrictum]|uniref:DoxX family protein n=1 Tax=Flavobacterium restrictum TaxID=2594428 RepID=A0A553EDF1_9FLAO|nr:DoxX family protein [Flavobacterium restrictum]TRX43025.1 DoxX family protein [Flavobacterium restrictum]